MHNLGNVIKFEILKQIRKPLFWVAIFIFPALMVVIGGISYLSTKLAIEQGETAMQELEENLTSIIVVDHTKIVNLELFGNLKVTSLEDEGEALNHFKASEPETALIIYPADTTTAIKAYTKLLDDRSVTQQLSMGVGSLASSILTISASSQVDASIVNIIANPELTVDSQILDKDGVIYNPLEKMVVPGIFLAIFFLIFVLTGNQTLVATTEEKENRVAEMILTTVDAKAVIIGKIIALVALGFIQIISLLTPLLLIYFAGTKLDIIPSFLASIIENLHFDFWPTFFGANFLVFGFLLATGFTILIGSLFPTAQDASQFYAPIILCMVIPFYFAGAIMVGAKTIFIQILSFFPLSAPITLMLRNTAGNLSITDGLIGLAIVIISSVVVMLIAVRTFRHGIFEYTKPTSLKDLFGRS